MSYAIDADHTRTYLLPPAVDDWIPQDHPVRFINAFVDEAFDSGRLHERPIPEMGRPPYSDRLLLKLWLAGYLLGIRATRRLEQSCREYLPLIWLATGEQPDHNTLWRFWCELKGQVGELFGTSVRVAVKMGLVGMAMHAIDGTKLQAAGSTRRAVTREGAEKRLEKIGQSIEKIEAEIQDARQREHGEQLDSLTKELHKSESLRKAIGEQLEKLPEEGKHSLAEPEARMMKGTGLGYNGQIAAEPSGIIVAQDLVCDQNDTKQLVPMIDAVVKQFGRAAHESVGDGGYNTHEALAEAESRGYSVLVSPSPHDPELNNDPYHSSKFVYDDDQDTFTCPVGEVLGYLRNRTDRRRGRTQAVRIYGTTACKTCPVRGDCTRNKRGRLIELYPGTQASIRQRKKRVDPEKQAILRKRMPVGERPFSVIKSNLAFTRFRVRGLINAAAEWAFICLVNNMKVIIQYQKAIARAIA